MTSAKLVDCDELSRRAGESSIVVLNISRERELVILSAPPFATVTS